jgi:hypothetical protein
VQLLGRNRGKFEQVADQPVARPNHALEDLLPLTGAFPRAQPSITS